MGLTVYTLEMATSHAGCLGSYCPWNAPPSGKVSHTPKSSMRSSIETSFRGLLCGISTSRVRTPRGSSAGIIPGNTSKIAVPGSCSGFLGSTPRTGNILGEPMLFKLRNCRVMSRRGCSPSLCRTGAGSTDTGCERGTTFSSIMAIRKLGVALPFELLSEDSLPSEWPLHSRSKGIPSVPMACLDPRSPPWGNGGKALPELRGCCCPDPRLVPTPSSRP
mmetsp:Transcript_39209/g.111020  ORF Transcript_39209/g.111020 Transcript_39209/m.111020 type:complete len:219 (+) Transcript_39209:1124-1780(+)